ncbi:MAG TPA: hypothetical protein P5277_02020 [Candidatus Paceibacterota bacterium]|nr:hypothetical protein [Candidatus Paceibacterota bacterium]
MIKKRIVLFLISVIIFSFLVTAFYTSEEKASISQCKKDCAKNQADEKKICASEHVSCVMSCSDEYSSCLDSQMEKLELCQNSCYLNNEETKSCLFDCTKQYKLDKRNFCRLTQCKSECTSNRIDCNKLVKERFKNCGISCPYINKNITCEDGRYKAGEMFLDGCDICTCNFNSKVNCKKSDFCNFKDMRVSENECVEAGGFYQQLCKGPYFGIGCGKDYYCQCDGVDNYTCPSNYTCIKNFKEINIKQNSISGWKTLLGRDLGDIGLCAKNPVLDNCGNGICDNIITTISKTAETSFNCPADCN